MADYREYVDAEYETIEKALSSLPTKPLVSTVQDVFKSFKREIDKSLA